MKKREYKHNRPREELLARKREYQRKYRRTHVEQLREEKKRYRLKYREKVLESYRKYYRDNREAILVRARARRQAAAKLPINLNS